MKWIAAWFLFFVLLVIVARTRLGHNLIVYVLWLAVILTLVVNYQAVGKLFNPAQGSSE